MDVVCETPSTLIRNVISNKQISDTPLERYPGSNDFKPQPSGIPRAQKSRFRKKSLAKTPVDLTDDTKSPFSIVNEVIDRHSIASAEITTPSSVFGTPITQNNRRPNARPSTIPRRSSRLSTLTDSITENSSLVSSMLLDSPLKIKRLPRKTPRLSEFMNDAGKDSTNASESKTHKVRLSEFMDGINSKATGSKDRDDVGIADVNQENLDTNKEDAEQTSLKTPASQTKKSTNAGPSTLPRRSPRSSSFMNSISEGNSMADSMRTDSPLRIKRIPRKQARLSEFMKDTTLELSSEGKNKSDKVRLSEFLGGVDNGAGSSESDEITNVTRQETMDLNSENSERGHSSNVFKTPAEPSKQASTRPSTLSGRSSHSSSYKHSIAESISLVDSITLDSPLKVKRIPHKKPRLSEFTKDTDREFTSTVNNESREASLSESMNDEEMEEETNDKPDEIEMEFESSPNENISSTDNSEEIEGAIETTPIVSHGSSATVKSKYSTSSTNISLKSIGNSVLESTNLDSAIKIKRIPRRKPNLSEFNDDDVKSLSESKLTRLSEFTNGVNKKTEDNNVSENEEDIADKFESNSINNDGDSLNKIEDVTENKEDNDRGEVDHSRGITEHDRSLRIESDEVASNILQAREIDENEDSEVDAEENDISEAESSSDSDRDIKPSSSRINKSVTIREEIKSTQKKKKKRGNTSAFPNKFTKHYFSRFANYKISSDAYEVLNQSVEKYHEWMSDQLFNVSKKSGRKVIKGSDVFALMKQQGFVKNFNEIVTFAEQNLPMELSSRLMPPALAGNIVNFKR